jgi:hypothetical protein
MLNVQVARYTLKRGMYVYLEMGRLGILCLSWEKPPVPKKIRQVDPFMGVQESTSDPRYNKPDFHPSHYG